MSVKITQQYNKDFYAWAMHNAELLRQRKFSEIDIKNIAEEMESMGRSEKRELFNRLVVLIVHLLKWQLQPERRGKSWMLTIKNQRLELNDLLAESPSLKNDLKKKYIQAYERAIILATAETKIDETKFPQPAPFTLQHCLDSDFLPI